MIKRVTLFTILTLCFFSFHLIAQNATTLSFNNDWKFLKGDITGAEKERFPDTNWQNLDLPHDWSIEDLPDQSDSVIGPFSKSSIGGTSTGYTMGGTAWYRKHFTANTIGNKKTNIYFDGVYMNCGVWVNGKHVGNHPYGYTGVSYDIPLFLTVSRNKM
jgi:beta-galactosidase